MKPALHRGLDADRLRALLPAQLAALLPPTLPAGPPWALLLFPNTGRPVRSGAAARALARLPDLDGERLVVAAGSLTMEAGGLFRSRADLVLTKSDFFWTDASYERIHQLVSAPRKNPP
ncbi:MAG TPA: hypothetical protein VF615_09040 [Longimicrobiaceae bacterium]|jgi:hypothetical protein